MVWVPNGELLWQRRAAVLAYQHAQGAATEVKKVSDANSILNALGIPHGRLPIRSSKVPEELRTSTALRHPRLNEAFAHMLQGLLGRDKQPDGPYIGRFIHEVDALTPDAWDADRAIMVVRGLMAAKYDAAFVQIRNPNRPITIKINGRQLPLPLTRGPQEFAPPWQTPYSESPLNFLPTATAVFAGEPIPQLTDYVSADKSSSLV